MSESYVIVCDGLANFWTRDSFATAVQMSRNLVHHHHLTTYVFYRGSDQLLILQNIVRHTPTADDPEAQTSFPYGKLLPHEKQIKLSLCNKGCGNITPRTTCTHLDW